MYVLFFFFKQKTAYEMRISDWSSDVCSSDLRVVRAYEEWFGGYALDPEQILGRTFEGAGYDDIVLLRDIPLRSTCEHHMAPIRGVAHVAYLPGERVVGISKLARLVDAYARRLQIQERMTNEIADTLDRVLHPRGVAVVIQASHECISSRGIGMHGVAMVTRRSEEHTSELQSLMRISYA